MTYYARGSTGLAPRKGGTHFVASDVVGVAVHWNGPPVGPGATRGVVASVKAYLRGIQRYHQDTRGWTDVAYNLAVDNAGGIWELRGLDYRSGANGDTVPNRRYVAILAVLGQGQKPTAAMYAGLRTAVGMARKKYPHATQVRTHNDVRPEPTECPGPDLTAAIKRGDLEPQSKVARYYRGKPGSRTVRVGSRGDDVKFLKRWFAVPEKNGFYGLKLSLKVMAWKRTHKQAPSPTVGPWAWHKILGGK